MAFVISTAVLSEIRAQARAAAPRECCGLLLGEPGRGGAVIAIAAAANVAADPVSRFEIDPAVLLAVHRAARAGGPAILGHYHSHPAGRCVPSPVDAAMAEGAGEIWLIIGRDGAAAAWRAGPSGSLHGRFEPVELTVRPHGPLAPPEPERH
jgi:proteasome lid subunit RPN8/RPN11